MVHQIFLILAMNFFRPLFILTILVCLVPAGAYSQNVGGGLSLGPNFCQIDGDFYKGFNKIGISAGGYAWYDFNDNVGLQVEILYNTKGARANTGGSGIYHSRLNYIDVPVLANFRLFGDRDKGIMFQAGLVPGSLLFARLGPNGLISNVTNNFRRFSMEAGSGFTFFLAPKISAMTRWNYSIRDISAYADPTTSFRVSNHYITLALRFGLK